MMFDKLCAYYGVADIEQTNFIKLRTSNMAEDTQDSIAQKIIESRSKRYGFPDIAVLSKFLPEEKTPPRRYFWSVCNDCGAEFDYSLRTCPVCLANNHHSSGYKLRVSDIKSQNVVRFNIPTETTLPGLVPCVQCTEKDHGYCKHFGDPDWICGNNDFNYCSCKKCCLAYKKANKDFAREK